MKKCIPDFLKCNKMLEMWFDSAKKVGFVGGVLSGLIVHFILLSHMLMSQDGLWNSLDYSCGGWEVSNGRWGMDLVDTLRGDRAVSTVSTMLCILIVAFTAILLADAFELQGKLSYLLTAITLETSPALTITILHEYCSDSFCIGFLSAVFAAWIIKKCRNKIVSAILSAIAIMFSLAQYQNYVGVTAFVLVAFLLLDLIDGKIGWKKVVKKGIFEIGVILFGGILYYLSVKISLRIYNTSMASRYGMDQMTISDVLSSLGASLKNCYRAFFQYFFRENIIYNASWHRDKFWLLLFLFVGIAGVAVLIKNGIWKKWQDMLLVLVFLLILPAAANAIMLIVSEMDMRIMYSMQMLMVIPCALTIFERVNLKWLNLIPVVGTAMIMVILYTNSMADMYSEAYLKMTYDQQYAITNRVLDRMETTEGYYKGIPCMFAGIIGDVNYQRDTTLIPYTIGDVYLNQVNHGGYAASQGTWSKYLRNFFGMQMTICTPEQYTAIAESAEFEEMEIYPSESSVKIIDGVMVVKFLEEPYMP